MTTNMTTFRRVAQPWAERIFNDIRALSLTPASGTGVTRLGYTDTERRVTDRIAQYGAELGLEIERDAAGNLLMTLPGSDPSLPGLFVGSHADSVVDGGNYDGLAGIAAAFVAAAALKCEGKNLKRNLTVTVLRCEEQGLIGSKAMFGRLTAADLSARWRPDMPTLQALLTAEGIDAATVISGKRAHDKPIGAFIELHIEQGLRLLQQNGPRVGIVSGIRGMFWHRRVTVHGKTAHAGAIDYPFRHDALIAATDLITTMQRRWADLVAKEADLVYTVGVFETEPTATFNKIPGCVHFSLDARSMDDALLDQFYDELREASRQQERIHGVRFEFDPQNRTPALIADASLVRLLEESAETLEVPVLHEPSGAGHDAQTFGREGIPCAMIFIANQNDSHNPREAIEMDDFLAGAALLKETAEKFCSA